MTMPRPEPARTTPDQVGQGGAHRDLLGGLVGRHGFAAEGRLVAAEPGCLEETQVGRHDLPQA